MWFHSYTVKRELKKCKSYDEKLNKLIDLQMNGKLSKKKINKDLLYQILFPYRGRKLKEDSL